MSFFPAGVGGSRKSLPMITRPRCDLCKYCETATTPKQQPRGSGKVPIMFIGDYPDTTADMMGRPISPATIKEMIGPILVKHGVSYSDTVFVNALACKPNTKRGEKELGKAVDYCRPNVFDAIKKYKPQVIIPMGDLAIKSVIAPSWSKGGPFSAARWSGYQIPLDFGFHKAWVCPTHNVTIVSRVKNADREGLIRRSAVPAILFERHVKAALDKLKEKYFPKLPDLAKEVKVVWDEKEAVEALESIPDDSVIAFDFETTGLKPDRFYHQIICCSVCVNGDNTFVFNWTPKVQIALKKVLQNKRIGKLGSNIKFETRWCLKVMNTRVASWIWDTMLVAHVMDAREESVTSIKFLAFVLLGVKPWDDHIEPFLDSGKGGANGLNRIKDVSRRELLIYCGIDSYLEYKVAELQAHLLNVPGGLTCPW